MAYTHAQLTEAAIKLRNRPDHQNPAKNPAAINVHVSPSAQPIVAAVLASPEHAAIAAGQAPAPGETSAAAPLNPREQMSLEANRRHQICGFAATLCGTAVQTGVAATPFVPFKAQRMIVSNYTIAVGTDVVTSGISSIMVGKKPQFASLDSEPVGTFAAGQAGDFVRFDECPPSTPISAQVTLAASATFYGALVGVTRGEKNQARPQGGKISRLPIKPTTVAGGASANIACTPTKPFWPRKIVLDMPGTSVYGTTAVTTVAGTVDGSSFNIQEIFVGTRPQFVHAPLAATTAYVPGVLYSGLYDLWLDFDMADTNVPITFQVVNLATVSAVFGGVIEGDVLD